MKRTATVLGLFVVFLGGCASAKYTAAPAAEAVGGVSTTPSDLAAAAPAAPVSAAKSIAAEATVAKDATMPLASGARTARPEPQAGQLTAGVWDDNRNFDFWKPYQAGFVRDHGRDFAMFSADELVDASRSAAQGTPKTDLDIQLVLDTTGSMGDELSYLQTELGAIVGELHAKLPNVTPRWSLVVYRDKGDDYVTRKFDFTVDTTKFRADLRAQSAGGGGDIPEAVVDGLRDGLGQSWRRDRNVAKLAFWVADAPAHPGQGPDLARVLAAARSQGVHIYPIASSDTSPEAEYQMRSAAQLTGGRYVFLTNDSGIGNDHAEPHIPCYSVTRLDSAMVRMIENEMTGHHVEPESNEVLRAVGQPNAQGKCTLPSGALVASF